MTVIAVRDGVMAADSATWLGDSVAGTVAKIKRLRDGRLYAGCGERALIQQVMSWLNGAAPQPDPVEKDTFSALVAAPGRIDKLDHQMRFYDVTELQYAVDGSHDAFLLGALAAGASAEQAIRLAIQFCAYAGGDVQVERL